VGREDQGAEDTRSRRITLLLGFILCGNNIARIHVMRLAGHRMRRLLRLNLRPPDSVSNPSHSLLA
jgi:hypothetical protein